MRLTHDSQDYTTGLGVSSFASVMCLEAGEEHISRRGHLRTVSVVHSPDSKIEKELHHLFSQKYFEENSSTAFAALHSIAHEAVHVLNQRQITIDMAAFSQVENVAYLVCVNGARAVLIREGKATPILVSEEAEVKAASGFLQEADIVLLATQDFFECISTEILQDMLSEVSDIQSLKELIEEELTGYKKPLSFTLLQFYAESDPVDQGLVVEKNSNNGVRRLAVSLLDKAINLIPDKRLTVHNEYDASHISLQHNKKSKLPVIAGIGLLGVLMVSILLGMRAREEETLRNSYESELQAAQHEYDEAQTLAGINTGRAKELILSAQQKVDQLQERGITDPDVQVLGTSIEQSLGNIAGIYKQDAQTFFDLTLIRADFQGDDLSFSNEQIGILDATKERVTVIQVETKRTENLGDLDLAPNALQLAAYDETFYLLSSDGIREIQDNLALVVRSENWDARSAIVGAFGGNLYVLDTAGNTIWRYPGGGSTFGEGQEWIGEGLNVSLTNALSWSIDGRVWVLSTDGVITVYDRGVPRRLTIEGVTGLSGATKVFTDESSEYLYVLDPVNARVVALDKNGMFVAEYQTSILGTANDFVVSEAQKKIIFIQANRLWELPLSHLN